MSGHPAPIHYYREKELETELVCEQCGLRYAIYGVFAFCPHCGAHNSLQMLARNLEIATKEVGLSATVEEPLRSHLVGDALENAVSSFDGFGREAVRVHALKASNPTKAENLSFQDLRSTCRALLDLFGFDLAAGIDSGDWDFVCCCFQKRHLLAHKMGVVDAKYLKATSDENAVAGRKVTLDGEEVMRLTACLRLLGQWLVQHIVAERG